MAAVGAAYAAATAAEVAMVAASAVAIAAAGVQAAQASKNASAQEDAARIHNEQLTEQTIANYDELADVELDSQQRALDDSLSVQKDYLVNKGRVNVMAAAMGTGGQSVASQLGDIEREKYSNYNTILLSRQAEQDNIKSQAESMRYQAASGMNVSPVSRPSWAGTALNIGGMALSAYSSQKTASTEASLVKPAVKSGV